MDGGEWGAGGEEEYEMGEEEGAEELRKRGIMTRSSSNSSTSGM